jgi:hypothetical protein
MKRLKKNCCLFELEPFLVKEWHPTANGHLTPRNVKIIYPKKIWWLCNESHEWRATIKGRIKGYGCPICEKVHSDNDHQIFKRNLKQITPDTKRRAISKRPYTIIDSDFLDVDVFKNVRKSRRYKSKETAILEIPSSGHWIYAQVNNFSHSGMYIETEASIEKETRVKMKLNRPIFYYKQSSYSSIVRWCKRLKDENGAIYAFGLGVKFA